MSTLKWNDLDDDDWQDMPVIHSDPSVSGSTNPFSFNEEEDRRRYHWNAPTPAREHRHDSLSGPSAGQSTTSMIAGGAGGGNATGRLIDVDSGGQAWKEKDQLDEMDYTRLELDDDPDEDEISMRTQYLFNEDKGMTPLSQMQTTKTLLTEGQRIAYVGLCRLVAREMVQTLAIASKGAKELEPARDSCRNWANKIMGRLYRHMEVDGAEQRMIEQLAEHGVTAEDLTPSLMSTYTVDNPEYDPEAAQAEEEERLELEREEAAEAERRKQEEPAIQLQNTATTSEDELEKERRRTRPEEELTAEGGSKPLEEDADRQERIRVEEEEGRVARAVKQIERRTSLMLTDPVAYAEEFGSPHASPKRVSRSASNRSLNSLASPSRLSPGFSPAFSSRFSPPTSPTARSKFRRDSEDDEGGDIGSALNAPTTPKMGPTDAHDDVPPETPTASAPPDLPSQTVAPGAPAIALVPPDENGSTTPLEAPSSPALSNHQPDNFLQPMPSSLPGVTTKLSTSDKEITLDIRWTILCDLFLSLIADSVYDARSRVLLCMMADKLGLAWVDVVRFERRLTEALEIQESVKQKEHLEVLEQRRAKDQNKRYVMMGLATLGGGLVIGLSAGLLAPVIGAGLGAALTTVGVSGTTGFLAGAGGAAIISSGATLTGATIGGKAMAKRTRHVKTFDFLPLHNNKRVNFLITIPGFMNGPLDDVRLPFSPLDPLMGDVFSVLWEPEMMGDTGNALKILSTEVLTQAGQQVLALTVMTALMSALQWPMMLTKLSYLIDNPWSNALDRARQAGAVLADILINRRLGVRPVSLVGFSLGARVIFYALVELAKANAFGVVQEVYLFGATVTAPNKTWRQVRGVVAGRFVNAFAMNDWVLGYLFRATSGGLQTVAGLRPIDHVPDLENVDVTHLIVGHMSYRTLMPALLKFVGFKVTADHFDEPEEMEPDAPDREVLTAEEEQIRKEKKSRKKVLGIFPRSKKNTPTSSAPMSRAASHDEYDDLPPRMPTSSSTASLERVSSDSGGDRGQSPNSSSVHIPNKERSSSTLSVSTADSAESSIITNNSTGLTAPNTPRPEADSAAPSPAIPSGFDLDKLRAEVAQLPSHSKPPANASLSTPASPRKKPVSRQHEMGGEDERGNQQTRSTQPASTLAHPTTDLTNLDTTLDPRELLRRQWAGEAIASTNSTPLNGLGASYEENGWGAPLPPSGTEASNPTFVFGDASGDVSTSWTMPTPRVAAVSKGIDDDVPDPAGAPFVWSSPHANASTTSFRENPW